MKKKIILSLVAALLIVLAVFSGFAYYLNKPDMVVKRAFSSKETFNVNGSTEFKVNFDTSNLMNDPEVSGNPFILIELQAVKSALESSSIKFSYNGAFSKGKINLNGQLEVPQMLGKSSSYSLYAEQQNLWTRQDNGDWVKSQAQKKSPTEQEKKENEKAFLDYLKSCAVTQNGDNIIVTMSPKYKDIKGMIPKETLGSINNVSKDGLNFEQVIDGLDIKITLTIKKDSKFFIPNPYVSKVDLSIKGALSKFSSAIKDIPDDSKKMMDAVSFTANGTSDVKKSASSPIEKPKDIK